MASSPPTKGEIVAGVIQRDNRANARGMVVVRLGTEAKGSDLVIPAAEQVPGERYEHGNRVKCYVVGVTRGSREPVITLSRTHPNLVRKSVPAWRSRRLPTARWRSWRWPGRQAIAPRSRSSYASPI